MKIPKLPPDFYGIHFLASAIIVFALFFLVVRIDRSREDPEVIRSHVEKVLAGKEALAEDLARLCLETSGVRGVRIRVEKTQAIAFTASVGVEIFRGDAG